MQSASHIFAKPVGVRMNIIPVIAGTDSVILQVFADVSAITSFADLITNHLVNVGGTAQIVDGANTILLDGVDFSEVGVGLAYSADDFIF